MNTEAHGRNKGRFFLNIEALRGVAVFQVVIYHAFAFWLVQTNQMPPGAGFKTIFLAMVAAHATISQFLGGLLAGPGSSAVVLFFVISGFVLGESLDRRYGTSAWLPVFVWKRILRIYPAAIVAILAWQACGYFVGGVVTERPWLEVLKNISLLSYSMNPVTWSLQVEIGAVPAIVAIWYAGRKWGVPALLGCAAALSVLAFFVDHPVLKHLMCFAAGLIISKLRIPSLSKRPSLMIFLAFAALIFVRPYLSPVYNTLSIFVETVCAFFVVYIVAEGSSHPAKCFLEWAPVKFLGKISYSFYLYNFLALQVWIEILKASGIREPMIGQVSVLVLGALTTLPVAWLSYTFIERGAFSRKSRTPTLPVATSAE